ncbi:MAG: hypothetical protein WHT47_03750 [Hydrogenothermaceae bacterium]
MFKKIIFGTGIFAMFSLPTFSAESTCKIKIDKNQKGEKRSVILAGGNGYQLFEGYLNELNKNGIKAKPGDIKVYIHTGTELKEFTLSWQNWLSGKSPEEIWKSKLSKYEAKINNQELAKADKMGMDIYCVSTETTETVSSSKSSYQGNMKKGACSPDSNSHIQVGIQFINNKDYDNAIKEFEAATKSSNCPLAYANLVQAYLLKNNLNFAVDTYKKGVELAGNDGFLHFSGAVAYTAKKEFDYALTALDNALKYGFVDKKLLDSKDLDPLYKTRKGEFCNLMDKYKVVLKKCL